MNEQPLVSIITCFFNAEKYISCAIESVLAQTYPNWELLLIDDGSTDTSTNLAKDYAIQYPDKIYYFEHLGHTNRGKSSSRNLGLKQARGEFITFLDADDVFMPDKLMRQVPILQTEPAVGMLYGPTLYWYSWAGEHESHKDYLDLPGLPGTLLEPPRSVILYLQNPGSVPCNCSLLVRRKVIAEVGGFDETFQNLYEDQVFNVKIGLKAPVLITGEYSAKYRQHAESSSTLAIKSGEYLPDEPHPARLTFLHWLETYFAEQGIKDRALWEALAKSYRPYRNPVSYRLSHFPLQVRKNFVSWSTPLLSIVRQLELRFKQVRNKAG